LGETPFLSRTGSRSTLVLALVFTTTLGACTHPIPRGRVSDFFAKDVELKPYKKDEQRIGHQRHRVQPSPAAAAMGMGAAAYAGGYADAWRAGAAAALGVTGGAMTGSALSKATREEPLPEEYTGLELALPIVSFDPNAGLTVGLLPVSIFREEERITNIFAPQITWNEIDGYGALFRMRRSFTEDANGYVDAGSTTNGANNYDLRYAQGALGPYSLLFFRARARYVTELSDRFYGLGSDSKKSAEATYTFDRAEAQVALGVNFPYHLKLEFAEQLSTNSVHNGIVSGLPNARTEFPTVAGMNDRTDLLSHRVTLSVDTRDSLQLTTSGFLVEGYYEIGDATLASDVSFQKAGLTASGVLSYWEKKLATAARVNCRFVSGKNVPFYEQTSIGGKYSLRGFPDGRFVGKNGFAAGIEERWNFLDFRVYDHLCVLQVAGFGECGRIFGGGDSITFPTIRLAAGGAFRLLVPASDIVTSVDIGYSKEGVQTFVDLGYPF
jgi:hypothetical protein